MTIRYKEWPHKSILPGQYLTLQICWQTYDPKETDTMKDVKGVILTVPKAMTWGQFTANGMSWITDTLKSKLSKFADNYPEKVDQFIADFPNREVLKESVKTGDFKDSGVKWYVTSFGDKLCFAEEI